MKNNKSKYNKNAPLIFVLLVVLFVVILTRNLIISLIIGFLVISLVAYFQTPKGKGKIGEFVVKILLGRNKPRKDKYSVHNLTFLDGNKSVQIDHIVVNKCGIHVIETKNYAGRIYGDEYKKEWTQVLSFGKVKHKLHNPIHQNYGHIMSLKTVLNIDKTKFHSYIIFTGRAEIMNKFKTPVIYPIDIRKQIKNKKDVILTSDEVKDIHNKLLEMKKTNKITDKEHVESIKSRINQS